MSKSQRLRRADELDAVRLVNECRELGDDAMAWQKRLVDGLLSFTGGMVSAVGVAAPHEAGRLDELDKWTRQQIDGGWPSAKIRDRWMDLVSTPEMIMEHPGTKAFFQRPEPNLSCVRQELVANAEWDRSAFVNDYLRADGFDEGLVSRTTVPAVGASYVLTVMRERGAKPFSSGVSQWVAFLQQELACHLGKSLLVTLQPNRHGLSPRLLQVLDRLLDGDSERQAALCLGLHPSTVHDYVKRLYRHFGVNSRPELLAYFLRRYSTRRPT
ncbi:helix-turn-helix transcriptional regulator [Zavarzinella formosa]|uniref:helix-turn-helix transcriptional regulator n=1 Tax=Zavarzinella formosa TaxID=360055 RepID=UPI0002EA5DFC|nr:LuxR C-terminal-related transcriptional regulator [Zavarzinella formosa]